MIVHYYSLYDTIAKEHIRLLSSKDDKTMERSVEYIVRDPKFDKIQGKDLVVMHVFDFDSETGAISNNDQRTICAVATAMAKYEAEVLTQQQIALERKVSLENGKSVSGGKSEKV